MYSLLIIDDEEEIRKGMINSIAWDKWGYHVIGEADNGEKAMALISILKPDVILSDIRMPGVCGTELMEWVHDRYPEIKMIILSGYSDSKYLDISIKNNVFAYLLKPTDLDEFEQTFRALYQQLNQQREEQEKQEMLKRLLKESSAYMYNHLLSQLLQGGEVSDSELLQLLSSHDLPKNLRGCRVVAVGMRYTVQYFQASEEERRRIKQNIAGVLNELLEQERGCKGVYWLTTNGFLIGLLDADNAALSSHIAVASVHAEQGPGIELQFGVSERIETMQDIPERVQEARFHIDHWCARHEKPEKPQESNEPEGLCYPEERELTNALFEHDIAKIHALVSGFFRQFSELPSLTFASIDYACMKLLILLSDCTAVLGMNLHQMMQGLNIPFAYIYEVESISGKLHYILYCVRCIEDAVKPKYSYDLNERMVREIQDFIDKEFCSPQLSLQLVADYIQKSPSYISKLFKETKGISFLQYVRKKRMDKSLELLAKSNTRVGQVAEAVGYTDICHFMKTFKKYHGITPSHFQQLQEKMLNI